MRMMNKTLLIDRYALGNGSMRKEFAKDQISEGGAKRMAYMERFWKLRFKVGADRTTPCRMPYGVRFVCERARIVDSDLMPSAPWEGLLNYASFLLDPRDGKYKCWYTFSSFLAPEKLSWIGEGPAPEYGNAPVGYAESEDGLHWTRPSLPFWAWDGVSTNLLGCKPFDGGVTYDSKRNGFLCVWGGCDSEEETGEPDPKKRSYAYPAFSSDGIHWEAASDKKTYGFFDSQNTLVYDKALGKYAMYLRNADQGRCICRAEGDAPDALGELVTILRPDNEDALDEDFYTNAISFYPGDESIRLLFPAVYVHHNDSFYLRAAVSRDGRKFDWISREPAALPIDGRGEEIKSMYSMSQLTRVQGSLALPLLLHDQYHERAYNEWFYETPLHNMRYAWAMWEEDRLAGLYAEEQGEVYTKPFRFSGDRLLVNARVNRLGALRVEVLLADDNPELNHDEPAPGMSIEEGDDLRGDLRWTACAWNGRSDVSTLRGKTVVLRFRLCDAYLFGYAVANETED